MIVVVWREISEADIRPVDGYQSQMFQMFSVYGRKIYQRPPQSLLHNSAVGKGGHCASNLRQITAKLPLTMWKTTSTCVLDPFRNGLSRSL